VTSRAGVTLHRPRRRAIRVPSASRASARPQAGSPHSVATSGRGRVAQPAHVAAGDHAGPSRRRAAPRPARGRRGRRHPFYAGPKVGVPSVPAIVEALSGGRYDLVHLCSPGPAGAAAAIVARMTEMPVVGSFRTELAAYAALRTEDPRLALGAQMAIAAFYRQCRTVLSPSAASDAALAGMGIAPDRIERWDRGVDTRRFRPRATRRSCPASSTSSTPGA
jgi:hypothetical protein